MPGVRLPDAQPFILLFRLPQRVLQGRDLPHDSWILVSPFTISDSETNGLTSGTEQCARPQSVSNLGDPDQAPCAEKCLAHSMGSDDLEKERAGGFGIYFSRSELNKIIRGYVVFVVDLPCHTSYPSTAGTN